MRTKIINKDKPEATARLVKSDESSASIPVGTPVVFQMDGTDDGLAVVLPSSSTAVKATAFFAGIITRTITPNELADAIYGGFCQNALVSRGTRAATTDAWPSFPAQALGDVLTIDTVANALAYSTVGAASMAPIQFAYADATRASTTTAASSAYSQWAGKLAATYLCKVVVRSM